jgi:hypothetical protein
MRFSPPHARHMPLRNSEQCRQLSRLARSVSLYAKEEYIYRILVGKPEGDNWRDLDVGETEVLKCILEK